MVWPTLGSRTAKEQNSLVFQVENSVRRGLRQCVCVQTGDILNKMIFAVLDKECLSSPYLCYVQ